MRESLIGCLVTLINKQGQRFFVKFHWLPELGVHSLVWDEMSKICGRDPGMHTSPLCRASTHGSLDFHRKDLEEDITTGVYPTWKLAIQVIPEAREHDFDFDILDVTRIWPKELVRWRSLVSCVLNRTVDE